MASPVFGQWDLTSRDQLYRLECIRQADKNFRSWQFRLLALNEENKVVAIFDEKKVSVQLSPDRVKLRPLASLFVGQQDTIMQDVRFAQGGRWRGSIEFNESHEVVTLMIVNY